MTVLRAVEPPIILLEPLIVLLEHLGEAQKDVFWKQQSLLHIYRKFIESMY